MTAADPFLCDLRYKLLNEIVKIESTKSSIKVTVANWVQPSVEGVMNSLKYVARGGLHLGRAPWKVHHQLEARIENCAHQQVLHVADAFAVHKPAPVNRMS